MSDEKFMFLLGEFERRLEIIEENIKGGLKEKDYHLINELHNFRLEIQDTIKELVKNI